MISILLGALLSLAPASAQEPCQIRIQGLRHAVVFDDGVRALLRSEDACAPRFGAAYELYEPTLVVQIPTASGVREHRYTGLRGSLSSDRSLVFLAGNQSAGWVIDFSTQEIKSRAGDYLKLRAGERPFNFRTAR